MYALLPYLLSSGLIWAFVIDDFTSKIVKPTLGVQNMGFVMAMNGGASVTANLLCSRCSDTQGATSRNGLFLFGVLLTTATTLFLVFFKQEITGWVAISAVSVAMGFGSACTNTMLNAHLSAFWADEIDAAFGCAQTFLGLAQAIGFFLAGSLPMHTTLLFAAPAQIAGGIGFCYSAALSRNGRMPSKQNYAVAAS